jgi:hypothetical protein
LELKDKHETCHPQVVKTKDNLRIALLNRFHFANRVRNGKFEHPLRFNEAALVKLYTMVDRSPRSLSHRQAVNLLIQPVLSTTTLPHPEDQ